MAGDRNLFKREAESEVRAHFEFKQCVPFKSLSVRPSAVRPSAVRPSAVRQCDRPSARLHAHLSTHQLICLLTHFPSVHPSNCLSVGLFLSVGVCLSVGVRLSVGVSLSICCTSVCLSIYKSVCLFISLSASLSLCLSDSLSVSLSVCMSV
jgi:hypothetical protein